MKKIHNITILFRVHYLLHQHHFLRHRYLQQPNPPPNPNPQLDALEVGEQQPDVMSCNRSIYWNFRNFCWKLCLYDSCFNRLWNNRMNYKTLNRFSHNNFSHWLKHCSLHRRRNHNFSSISIFPWLEINSTNLKGVKISLMDEIVKMN